MRYGLNSGPEPIAEVGLPPLEAPAEATLLPAAPDAPPALAPDEAPPPAMLAPATPPTVLCPAAPSPALPPCPDPALGALVPVDELLLPQASIPMSTTVNSAPLRNALKAMRPTSRLYRSLQSS